MRGGGGFEGVFLLIAWKYLSGEPPFVGEPFIPIFGGEPLIIFGGECGTASSGDRDRMSNESEILRSAFMRSCVSFSIGLSRPSSRYDES